MPAIPEGKIEMRCLAASRTADFLIAFRRIQATRRNRWPHYDWVLSA
jgi:hypothetical protein